MYTVQCTLYRIHCTAALETMWILEKENVGQTKVNFTFDKNLFYHPGFPIGIARNRSQLRAMITSTWAISLRAIVLELRTRKQLNIRGIAHNCAKSI